MTPIESLIRVLARCALDLGMGDHSFIVGGAPRDFVLGHPVKDIDVVVEARNSRTAAMLAQAVGDRLGNLKIHPDRFGVCHIGPVPSDVSPHGVSLKGQKVEVVGARKEKYDRSRGKESHKPSEIAPGTILEDLLRRDFTINTLMWRLGDLLEGPEKAPVVDLLDRGLPDLRRGVLQTPLNPLETFDDDPSRMLRAVRFAVKFNFELPQDVCDAIVQKAPELGRLPFEAIDALLFDKVFTMPSNKVLLACGLLQQFGLWDQVLKLIPKVRMRRALKERIHDMRLRVALTGMGADAGLGLSSEHFKIFADASKHLTDIELEGLFEKAQHPLDTTRFIELSGAQGPAIGKAVDKARELVLLGMGSEEVMQRLLERAP